MQHVRLVRYDELHVGVFCFDDYFSTKLFWMDCFLCCKTKNTQKSEYQLLFERRLSTKCVKYSVSGATDR